ncbi:hypothetical protein RclHR1_02220006 [Rhizophagus clarus]|uniref:Uncharacterized protein n=1 Tax=Rhizophagus clarus TaxID=94130 RepID=A0A2Z6R9U1_9GLOM|nr:hypothetical protein RclHR1_02220006 [Rhizophagus clarus]
MILLFFYFTMLFFFSNFNMKVPRKNKISSSVVYTKPTKEQKEYYKQKPVVENTHLCNVHLLYISLIKLFNKCKKIYSVIL